jgi:hypothetical protein
LATANGFGNGGRLWQRILVRMVAFLLKERLYLLWPLGCFVLKGRAEMSTEIKPCFSKAATALLHAYNGAWCGSRLFC